MNLLQEDMKKLAGVNDNPIPNVMSWKEYVTMYMHILRISEKAKELYIKRFAVMPKEIDSYDRFIKRVRDKYNINKSTYTILAKSMGKERMIKQLNSDKKQARELLKFVRKNL